MEVRETAACGITEREFAIDLTETEIISLYKFVKSASEQIDGFNKDLVEELLMQTQHIVGPAVDM